MKNIILLAGFPATGKTYLAKVIKSYYPHGMYIAQDDFKELLYDTIGFATLVEKEKVVELSREMFYQTIKMSLKSNQLLLLDYPFSYKQVNFLDEIAANNEVNIMTIRLTGDLDVLYDRRVQRDIKPERNKGHILNCYHGYETYTLEDYPLSRQEYKYNCLKGKYHQFSYGKTIEVDVTDYAKIDYNEILSVVREQLKG